MNDATRAADVPDGYHRERARRSRHGLLPRRTTEQHDDAMRELVDAYRGEQARLQQRRARTD